jgi:DNA-binding beta-propeller fold protein YncE
MRALYPAQLSSVVASLLAFMLLAKPAAGQLAVVATDNKLILVNGVTQVARNAAPDTLALIDLKTFPPRLVAEIDVPASVIGPPLSVAVTPDEGLALVTAAMKIDPDDPTKQVDDTRLSVIDLQAQPPKLIATLETGKQPAGLSINRQGTLALVANRAEGSVSIFGIAGKTVTSLGTLKIAEPTSGVSHVAITPDGTRALVTRDNDHTLTLLSIDGNKVALAGRDLRAGLRPYGADISRDGRVAVTANVGPGNGDSDTLSVIDMAAQPPRVVDTLTVGQTPEGIKLSPDGTLCAVVVMNGSNKPKESPFFSDHGKLVLFRVEGLRLTRVGEAAIGHWSQAVAFSADNRTLLVSNMVEKDIQVLRWDGTTLRDSGERIKLKGGPVAIRTAEK